MGKMREPACAEDLKGIANCIQNAEMGLKMVNAFRVLLNSGYFIGSAAISHEFAQGNIDGTSFACSQIATTSAYIFLRIYFSCSSQEFEDVINDRNAQLGKYIATNSHPQDPMLYDKLGIDKNAAMGAFLQNQEPRQKKKISTEGVKIIISETLQQCGAAIGALFG